MVTTELLFEAKDMKQYFLLHFCSVIIIARVTVNQVVIAIIIPMSMLPPMLQNVHQRHRLNMQAQQEEEKVNSRSLTDVGYDMIDSMGVKFRKVAPYINKTLEWSWIPFVIYYGLKQGTHKYYPSDPSQMPVDVQDMRLERPASWTDVVPFFGSHGAPQPGLLQN